MKVLGSSYCRLSYSSWGVVTTRTGVYTGRHDDEAWATLAMDPTRTYTVTDYSSHVGVYLARLIRVALESSIAGMALPPLARR